LPNPTVTFPAHATYPFDETVSLTVKNSVNMNGNTKTQTVTVTNPAAQVASISVSPANPLQCQAVTITANATGQAPLAYSSNIVNGSNQAVIGGPWTTNPFSWNSAMAAADTYTATVTVSNNTPPPASLSRSFTLAPLPTLAGSFVPAAGARVGDPGLLSALTVLGAAPGPFAKVVARVYTDSNGLTVAMRNGLLAYFGDATRPHAKWLSLARVLADRSSAGASYVDVRVPEHPAAGFPSGSPPISPSAQASGTPESAAPSSAAGSEGTIGAIAARLAGPKGSESASSPQEAASAATNEPNSPSGANERGSSSAASATRAESEETPSASTTPAPKGP
jgi:PKD repeat protein